MWRYAMLALSEPRILPRFVPPLVASYARHPRNPPANAPQWTCGTLPAFQSVVTVAIPIWQERVSPVLDTATRLLVVNRDRHSGVRRREVLLGPLAPGAFARSLAELHVDVLLCAALSEPLQRALQQQGVRVRSHLCGNVEAVLRAFCCRRLAGEEFRMPGCWGRHVHGECCHRRASHGNSAAPKKTRKGSAT